ncbi:aldo/keto reductase [Paraliomyxa miuraensis]|uniref:aldo/keto reductase n=1 Tax=Paraliomyxa miuraensis TaxID=376150 RepID=UPI0022500E29|nr:aldo/keto reductase [Paraliomyxa miuraensis]MCX4247620.1 aldo/keto reductase [Paraliomyxa miuraensis]
MQHVLVASGVEWPRVGLGTWNLHGRECRDAVEHALAIGYRHIDTAQAHGNESEVGAAIARSAVPRDQVWVTTKVAREWAHPAHVQRTTEDSLRRLGMDHVDLLLVQGPPSEEVPLSETLEALRRLHETGKARFIGVADLLSESLREAVGLVPELLTNQIELNPLNAHYGLRATAQRLGVTLTACSPLARGQALDVQRLVEIGRSVGRSSAQVILRWLLQQGVVVIPKATSTEHQRENLEVFDFVLSEPQMEAIDEIDRASQFIEPIAVSQWE